MTYSSLVFSLQTHPDVSTQAEEGESQTDSLLGQSWGRRIADRLSPWLEHVDAYVEGVGGEAENTAKQSQRRKRKYRITSPPTAGYETNISSLIDELPYLAACQHVCPMLVNKDDSLSLCNWIKSMLRLSVTVAIMNHLEIFQRGFRARGDPSAISGTPNPESIVFAGRGTSISTTVRPEVKGQLGTWTPSITEDTYEATTHMVILLANSSEALQRILGLGSQDVEPRILYNIIFFRIRLACFAVVEGDTRAHSSSTTKMFKSAEVLFW
ncbi:hypothetical protein K435DRAFT_842628, partial [Dendrothele bispora CBS 962.96]